VTAEPLVSVVLPCLKEEAAIGACIGKIRRTFDPAQIDGEIVVCDNGPTDGSVAIGAMVVTLGSSSVFSSLFISAVSMSRRENHQ
jgi:hypothetical protein